MTCTCYAADGDDGANRSLWAPRLRNALSRVGAGLRALSGRDRADPEGRFSPAELLWFSYNREGYLPDRPFGPF